MVSAEPVEAEAETAITDALPTEAEAASGVNKKLWRSTACQRSK